MQYTIEQLKKDDLIIFEAVMGSHAYGTNTPTSDIDLRGIFVQPLDDIFEHGYVDQVADKKNDIVYYELRRFLMLAIKANPTVIELLFAPEDCINKSTSEWEMISLHAHKFLTKQSRFTFAGYAIDQIKKARGYNKKMNWEESKMTRKTVLEFCYILKNGGSVVFNKWLEDYNKNNLRYDWHRDQTDFGLANIDHAHNIYAMYDILGTINSGIVSDEKSNDVQLTSIPKELKPVGYLTFNKDAYSLHCKRYKEYQTWLKERNPDRVKMNKDHGKQYDSKNLMHTFRLLKVALEIAKTGYLNVRRSPEEIKILMEIRKGTYEYEALVNEAEKMIGDLDEAFNKSKLPEKANKTFITQLLLNVRKEHYGL